VTLVTTVGGANSNSYITAEEASSILTSIGFNSVSWLTASTAVKEYTLALAANLIGLLPLRGNRVYIDPITDRYIQALDFPRDIQSDTSVIPNDVKEAQAILAATVVYDSFNNTVSRYTPTDPSNPSLDNLIESGAIETITVGGVFTVKLASGVSSVFGRKGSLADLNVIPTILGWPVYMRMKPYLTQFRGMVLGD